MFPRIADPAMPVQAALVDTIFLETCHEDN